MFFFFSSEIVYRRAICTYFIEKRGLGGFRKGWGRQGRGMMCVGILRVKFGMSVGRDDGDPQGSEFPGGTFHARGREVACRALKYSSLPPSLPTAGFGFHAQNAAGSTAVGHAIYSYLVRFCHTPPPHLVSTSLHQNQKSIRPHAATPLRKLAMNPGGVRTTWCSVDKLIFRDWSGL